MNHVITRRRPQIFCLVFCGILIVMLALAADYILDKPADFGNVQLSLLLIGVFFILMGASYRPTVIHNLFTNLSIVLVTSFLIVVLLEFSIRIIGYDFPQEENAWRKVPPYYRRPIVPQGEVFFRRPGPQQWTGQVINTRMTQLGKQPNPYENEAVITVEYDRNGFRNPKGMKDWGIVVTGDSFTELGYLPYEELFTTILQDILHVNVLNLGVSHTGPLSQLSYLRTYGIARSTEHALIVFFEGNDLGDLKREKESLDHWQQTGEREHREFRKQNSLVKNVFGIVNAEIYNFFHQDVNNVVNAFFVSGEKYLPVTLNYTPLSRAQVSAETMKALRYFFLEFITFAKETRVTPWLAYMPSKRRILHDHIKFTDRASEELKVWQPTDLPELMSKLSAKYGVRFIDLTEPLVRETTKDKKLLYNSLYETHLNAHGSLVVGLELARQFQNN